MIQKSDGNIPIRAFRGLELEEDVLSRTVNSFSKLENFDLFVPGAIRKIPGAALYNNNAYDSPIVAIRHYRRTPDDAPILIGISKNGFLYNIDSGILLGNLEHSVDYPFATCFEGIYVPDLANPNPITIDYLITTVDDAPPYKYDGYNISPIGVSAPTTQMAIRCAIMGATEPFTVPETGITYNLQRGISILSARKYRWTYWNPTTRHESSPSPVFGNSMIAQDEGFWTDLFKGEMAINGILNEFIQLILEVPTTPPTYGVGYTKKRIYCTRDGSEEYYLIRGLANADVDGAIPLEDEIVYDGLINVDDSYTIPPSSINPDYHGHYGVYNAGNTQFYLVRPNGLVESYQVMWVGSGKIAIPGGFETNAIAGTAISLCTGIKKDSTTTIPMVDDSALVEPAPLENENEPPPIASWGAIYQGRLWLIEKNSINLRFSKIGNFHSFPTDNSIPFQSQAYDKLISLVGTEQQLIVGKKFSTYRIQGTDFSDFVKTPIDEAIGIVSKRMFTQYSGQLFFFANEGLYIYSGSGSFVFIGSKIRPLIDDIDKTLLASSQLMGTMDTRRGIALFIISTDTYPIALLALDVSEQSPYTIFKFPIGILHSIQEVESNDGDPLILAGGAGIGTAKVYNLWSGTGELTAIAETQDLPQDDIYSRKIFSRMLIEGGRLDGFSYSTSIDNGIWSPYFTLRNDNFLGKVGKQIRIQFKHTDAFDLANPPLLPNATIFYHTIGRAR